MRVDLAGYLIRPPANAAAPAEPAEPTPDEIAQDVRLRQYPYRKPFQYIRAGRRFRVLPCCYMVETTDTQMAERYGMDYEVPPSVIDLYNAPEFWRFRTDLAEGRAADLCGACMQAGTYPWQPK